MHVFLSDLICFEFHSFRYNSVFTFYTFPTRHVHILDDFIVWELKWLRFVPISDGIPKIKTHLYGFWMFSAFSKISNVVANINLNEFQNGSPPPQKNRKNRTYLSNSFAGKKLCKLEHQVKQFRRSVFLFLQMYNAPN